MHLHSYRLRNYRRLRDVRIELARDISIFVGSNNSGKTSAAQAIQMFLSGSKERFSLFDFSSHVWSSLDSIGAQPSQEDAQASLPSISLDLWFEVSEPDLHLVLPLLPSSAWQGTQVGLRIEFAARDPLQVLQNYRARQAVAAQGMTALAGGAGNYVAWPKSLSHYIEKELAAEYELRYAPLDRAQFDDEFRELANYSPEPFPPGESGGRILKSLLRVDFLNAQRHLADPTTALSGASGRAEDLSRRLSRFYKRNLEQRGEDHATLKALSDSEDGLNDHLMKVFDQTLKRIAALGYPGLHNPRMIIKSALDPANIMSQDAKVHYQIGEGATPATLPDSYNGLGFKNLIYMVVEILDVQARWEAENEERPILHLIFIEEPEAHLHAQLQQVFIRKVLTLVEVTADEGGSFATQLVVTTHSPHILYERGFTPIRYFRRYVSEHEQTTQVLNLSGFQRGDHPKDRDFLQRYLKLTHCDLFFADAAVLVEGNVERLLLPVMIERAAQSLTSASLCILEVGGAFCHRFKELIEFLGITTLIITDLDSVTEAPEAADGADEDDQKEFEVPAEENGGAPQTRFGVSCVVDTANAVTANRTLIQWLPKMRTVAELLAAQEETKFAAIPGSPTAKVRVAYQVPTQVEWNGASAQLCGRTFEETFGLENATWCQDADRRSVGLKLRQAPITPQALAAGLHRRVTGKHFDKTKFALEVLGRRTEDWVVPRYITEGLAWLQGEVDLELEQEVEAAAEPPAIESAAAVPEPAAPVAVGAPAVTQPMASVAIEPSPSAQA